MTLVLSVTAFAEDKHFDRNQLPQLNQSIIEQSDFTYIVTEVPVSSLKPVQTQRVKDLKKHEARLIKAQQDSYRPLVIDQQYYIIDGHHRYDALTEMGVENARVLLVNADIEQVAETFSEYQDDTPTYEKVVSGAYIPSESTVEEVVVLGTRATLLSAVDKQRNADNIISVVDSDAMGNFPDTTAAEAIRRISGVSVENDQGEGRYVTIRGLSSDLNAVAVNGASVVAPENGRSVMMDGLPTELLDSITVAKTLTPEMDADSIGGRVDFNTKRPSELKERLLKFKFKNKFGEYHDDRTAPNFSVTYGDVINDSASHIIGVTYSSKNIETFNNETGYGWEDGLMNDDFEMRYYDIARNRYGLSYDFDYITDNNSRLYLNAFYNEYDDAEVRLKDEYGKIKLDEVLENGITSSRVRHDAETRQRFETRKIGALVLGFDTMVNEWTVDTQASYSYALEDDSDNADITFRNYNKKVGGEFNWSNPIHPYFIPVDPTIRNAEELEFDAFEMWENVSEDKELALSFDADKEFGFGVLKVGAKYKSREKSVDDYIIAYEWDKTMADFDTVELDWFFPNQIFGTHASADATYNMRNLVDQMEVDFSDDLSRDFTTEEDVWAVYVQNTIYGDNYTAIAGVRYEHTTVDSTAFDQDGNPTFAKNDYGFLAPSFTIKYFLTEELQVRGALWRGLSRPGFTYTAPKLELDVDSSGDTSGKYGNPELKPYEANNFDLSLEYYGDGMTFAAIGIFVKDIDNAIYPSLQKEATINNIYFNDGVETWVNADASKIKGLELNFQYGWDSGVYVATNVTLTDGESTFAFDDANSFTTPFRKLADKAANLSVGYDKGAWDIRLAGNYRSEYLDYLADEEGDIDTVSANNSRFVNDYVQFDLTAKYKVNDNLTLKAEAINLGNEPEHYYWGNPNQLSQWDIYGTTYSVGFNYKL